MRNPTPLPKFKKGEIVKTPKGNQQILYWKIVTTTKGTFVQYHCVPLTRNGTVYKSKMRWADWNPDCRHKERDIEPLTATV